ncbi:MAG TPA: NAD(P)H-dependent oxidoreductase [Gaiellaceae bacterium]|nr:NAD(P)H-dependent oxidoreductase [Gaiellaceae bacterium]
MRILAISGSLRSGSQNSSLLRAAAELAPEGVELELYDGLKEIPPYDEDDDIEPAPAAVTRFREAIRGADAVLISTPEYNSSIPGVLKNALDWASRPYATNPFRNKPVAIFGSTHGAFGAAWAQADLKKIVGAIGARVLDAQVSVPHAHEKFDADGRLTDEELRVAVGEAIAAIDASHQSSLVAA